MAWPNEPKPLRATTGTAATDDEWPEEDDEEEESLPPELFDRHDPPEPPCPLEEELRDVHSSRLCGEVAYAFCSQLRLGIMV